MLQGRYVFTCLACLGNMICLLGRDSLRLAVLPMKEELNMTTEEVSHVLGGYNYGMMFSMLAGGPLSDILGGKWLLLLVTVLSGLCTALVPILASVSAPCLVTAQVLYGLAGGLVVPALSSMIARWEPLSERGRLATVIYTGSQFSAVFTSLVTGYITYHYDWRNTFYIMGSLPVILWTVPWVTLVTDNPAHSSLTSQSERALLEAEVPTSQQRPAVKDIPVWRMVTSAPVWAMIVANVGCSWAAVHTSLLLPQYLHHLQLPLHHTSLLSALPYIGSCILGLLSSLVFSLLLRAGLSQTSARKVCSSVCLFGFAALTLPVPFIENNTVLVTFLTTSAYAMTGFNLVGAWTNPLDIAPNFVGTLMGATGLFCYLTGALVPHTTSIMASLVETEETVWTSLFLLVSGAAVLANVVFLLCGTASLQHWNTLRESREILYDEEHLHNNLLLEFDKQQKQCKQSVI